MTHRILVLLAMTWMSLGTVAGVSHASSQQDPFRALFKDDVVEVSPGEIFEFNVRFKVPEGHYLYDDKTLILFKKTEPVIFLRATRPPAEDHYDPFFKKNLEVHFKDFTEKIFFKVPQDLQPGRWTLEAEVRYQGCSEDFCYRPVKKTILLPIAVVSAHPQWRDPKVEETSQPIVIQESDQVSFFDLLGETNPQKLLNQGRVYLLALALVGGVVTSFTPCVLPVIPLTLAFIGVKHRRRGNLMRALMLVIGMVAMYSFLGFLVASLGFQLGFLFQSRFFVLLLALFFFIFSLGLFEIIPFHLPPKLHHKFAQMGGEGPLGAFVAGLTVGLIASPCVGPLIGPLLLIAARSQDRFYGFLLLLSYGIGMGLLFLLLASGFAEINAKLKSGKWTHFLKRGMAVLMLVPALYYGYVFAKPYFGKPADALWVHQFDEGMEAAKASGKPILLDFYADWCPPCIELDKRTFSTQEVRSLAEKFVMLKIDCSFDDENCQKATERYEVVGWPTVLFLKSDGEIIEGVNLIGGFADKNRMLELMHQALGKIAD